MEAQQTGKPNPHPERILKNVNAFPARKALANGSYPGHAALIDWPYKIHAIGNGKKGTRYELYNLAKDPMESNDLAGLDNIVFKKMKAAIGLWQKSVMESLEGKDYPK